MRKRKNIVFDSSTSFFHVVLGLLVRFLSGVMPFLSLAITVTYITYQVLEKEDYLNKLGDFIEFIMGYMLGDILFSI